jgi:hypothetical protein
MKKLILVVCLLATACAPGVQELKTTTVQVETIAPPMPRPIQIETFEVEILEKEQLRKMIQESDQKNQSLYITTISSQSVANLMRNISETIRYIEQSQAVIEYYQQLAKPRNQEKK